MNTQDYQKRLKVLQDLQRKIDHGLFDVEQLFEAKNRHFGSRLADMQEELYKTKKQMDALKIRLQNLIQTLDQFAKKDQVEKVKELNKSISTLNFVTANQFKRMILDKKETGDS